MLNSMGGGDSSSIPARVLLSLGSFLGPRIASSQSWLEQSGYTHVAK